MQTALLALTEVNSQTVPSHPGYSKSFLKKPRRSFFPENIPFTFQSPPTPTSHIHLK